MYQYFYNCIPRESNQSNRFPQNCLSFSNMERYPFGATMGRGTAALSPHHVLNTDARVGIIHDL